MKILSIVVVRREPSPSKILASAYDLSSFNFFQKSSGQEFLTFFSVTLAERTPNGVRQSVEQDQNIGFVFTNLQGLSCVLVADKEYPQRVAFVVINKVLEEFFGLYSREVWMTSSKPLQYDNLPVLLAKYQDPSQADAIMKVQRELDETKVVLHQTINSLLERGERIDDLVDRSSHLGESSKAFYKAAKKTNSCCVIQ